MLRKIITAAFALSQLTFMMFAHGNEATFDSFRTKPAYDDDLSLFDRHLTLRVPAVALDILNNNFGRDFSNRLSGIQFGLSLQQPAVPYRYKIAKKKKKDHINLLNVWINSDLTRLFSPNLKNSGHIGLNFHYSLRRSPYLFLHYDRLKIKTKIDRRGLVLNDIRYDLGLQNSVFGIKLKNSDPRLYFRYRF